MAFWYGGKPENSVYREFAAFHILKNLARNVNESECGESAINAAKLKGAVLMLESQGYKIRLGFQNGIIYNIRIHILDTDEVLVFELVKCD